MVNTKLSKAITMALAGSALALGSVSVASATSTTMYNMSLGSNGSGTAGTVDPTLGSTYNSAYKGVVDGWSNGAGAFQPTGTNSSQSWAGTSGPTTAAFGYSGAHLNWGAEFTGGGSNTATISTFDAFSKYGAYADIDVAKGAWSDNALSGAGGWRHDLDMGLFKTDTAGTVTLSAAGILQSGTDFGFTIFKGVDSVTNYNHHGAWNAGNNTAGLTSDSLPWNGGGALAGTPLVLADIVAYSVGGTSPASLNNISFDADAGQIYSIFIGGYRNGAWGDTVDAYSLEISQTPVPVPAAAWLFGGALMSLLGANRRKKVLPA